MSQKVALFTFFLSCYCLYAQANTYDTLYHLQLNDKIAAAKKIFSDKVHRLDSAQVVKELNFALTDAGQHNDHAIKIIADLYLAQVYDRTPGNDPHIIIRYYEDAIQTAARHDIELLNIESVHKLGLYYFRNKKYPLAFENLLKANEMALALGYDKVPDISKYLFDIGDCYYSFQDYRKAIVFLKQAQKYPSDLPRVQIRIPNTLALSYKVLAQLDSSYYYFQQAVDQATKNRDTVWIAIAKGNMGNILMLNKEYDKAIPLINYDYQVSMRYGEGGSAANCLICLSQIALAKGDIPAAERHLDSAKLLLRKEDELSTFQYLYKSLSALYARKHDMDRAYAYLDSFGIVKDSLARRNDKTMVSQAEAKVETEKHLAALQLLESKRRTAIILRNSIVMMLSLTLIIVIQGLYRLRQRNNKNKEILEIEKKRAQEERRNSEQVLQSYIESLKEKSQMIEDFKEEINRLQSLPNSPRQQEQQEVYDKLHSATLLTENAWLEFKAMFVKVHKDFFARLAEKYPDLTQGETRYLALTKLGLSVNEMSNMLGITPDSVRKLRFRLKKKLSGEEHAGLDEILSK